MSVDNHLHLEVRDILQRIKDAIDNEALWTKHYKNLREIEKDLPEEETKKDLPEDSQEAKSLDELLISDFLYLELKIYGIPAAGDKKNTMELVISKIKEIEKFIPMVFNFKERLKLVLCAVSHMDEGLLSLEPTKYSYDDIVHKFKKLGEIKMLDGNTNGPEEYLHNGNGNNINKLNEFLENKERIVKIQEDLVKSVKLNVNKKSKVEPTLVQSVKIKKTRKRSSSSTNSGGAINEGPQNNSSHNININTFFQGIATLNEKNPLKDLINSYNLNGNYVDGDKEKMFHNLAWISFSKMNKKDHKDQLEMLKDGFKSYIDNSTTPSGDKIKESVKFLVDQFTDFELFKKYLPSNTFNNEWPVNYFDCYTPILLLILGEANGLVTSVEDAGAEEMKGDEAEAAAAAAAAAAAKPQEVFNKYIEKLFEYSYAKLLIDKNIIEEEIAHQKKVEEQKHRSRDDINSVFESAKDPLLRMFLFFVSECVRDMSSKIQNLSEEYAYSFWDNLENNFPNKISLQDEKVNGTSLFDYVKTALEEKTGRVEKQETVIAMLVIKSKLIYLLQNYHYF